MLSGGTAGSRARRAKFFLLAQIKTPVTPSTATTSPSKDTKMRPGTPRIRPECSGNWSCMKSRRRCRAPEYGRDELAALTVEVEPGVTETAVAVLEARLEEADAVAAELRRVEHAARWRADVTLARVATPSSTARARASVGAIGGRAPSGGSRRGSE